MADKIENTQYRFFLVNGLDRRQITPLGSIAINWNLQDDTFFYENTLGSFTLKGEDYFWVKDIEDTGDLCGELLVEVERACGGSWELYHRSQWTIQSCRFADSKCNVTINPESHGLGSCLIDQNSTNENILQLQLDKTGLKYDSLLRMSDVLSTNLLGYGNGHMFYYSGGAFDDILIRPKFVDSSGNPATTGTPTPAPTPNDLLSAGLIPENEVDLIRIQQVGVYTSGIATVQYVVYVAWAYRRGEAKIAGNNPPTPNGYTIINDTVDPVVFQKRPTDEDLSVTLINTLDACATIGVIPSSADLIYNGARDGDTDVPAGGICFYVSHKDTIQFTALTLEALISLFIEQCDDTKIPVSDFFQINPENPSSTNYVTGLATLTNDIRFIQRSDNIFLFSQGATTGNMSFSDLAKILRNSFQVYWTEDVNGNLRLEHYVYFENITVSLDATVGKKGVFTKDKLDYSYKRELLPFVEEISDDGNHFNYNWDLRQIKYVDTNGRKLACVGSDTLDRSFGIINTDFEFFIEYPTQIPRAGWTMVACRTQFGNDEIIYEDNLLNGTLSIKRLVERYYNHGRSAIIGQVNGVNTTFESTVRLKTEEGLAFPICCDDDFDPRDNIKTPIGIGRVTSAEHNLKTNKLTTNNEY